MLYNYYSKLDTLIIITIINSTLTDNSKRGGVCSIIDHTALAPVRHR